MSLVAHVKDVTAKTLESLYNIPFFGDDILVTPTKPEFEGDYTVVLFALVKSLRKAPEALGNAIGEALVQGNPSLFTGYNVIKGFLNLTLADAALQNCLHAHENRPKASTTPAKKIMVEYSSPNTNKPLHLGHLRNNFLGWSIAAILKHNGYDVRKTCIVNDRGVHICKSMIAWQLFANGATPASTSIKGDHFVGDYYVRCENEIKAETAILEEKLQQKDYSGIEEGIRERLENIDKQIAVLHEEKDADKRKKLIADRKELLRAQTPIMQKTRQMLVDWENGKPEVMDLWKKMNGWVYEGFEATYKRIGSDFDKTYYESETYLLGRRFVDMGLQKGVFFRKEDGSVWIDLTAEGLDEKLVLRKDGTSVYITQDLGLAHQKYEEFGYDKSIYVIADEQNYHMKVLQLILQKLGMPYADGIFHLSYGMVELPHGRMKSREGTVVDADDLVNEMVGEATKKTAEKGKVDDFTPAELADLNEMIALGALKFFLLRVDPKKRIVFNPEESIDLQGFTGPFIQYTHARIKSILRKAGDLTPITSNEPILKREKELLLLLEQSGDVVKDAAREYNPSLIALYAFNVAKTYNTFYTEHSVLNAETDGKKYFRLQLCSLTATVIKEAMGMLGINVPERM